MRIIAIFSHIDLAEAHLLAGLHRAGMQLLVLCKAESRNLGILRDAGVPHLEFRIRRRIDTAGIRTIRAAVSSHAPEIIHTFNKAALVHALLATRGAGIRHITYRGIAGNLARWNPADRLSFFSPRVEHVVCVCDAVRDSLLALGMSPGKAVRIYKGHEPSWYQAWPRATLHEAHSIPAGKVVIGTSARWRPRKGLEFLLNTLAQLQHPNLSLLVAGEVGQRPARMVREVPYLRDTVHLTGDIPDAPARMGACDCFVMPSLRREGLAKAVIEAMIQGVPAIVSQCGGLPEMVLHEQSGLVVRPGHSAELGRAIARMADDAALRERLAAGARARMLDAFSARRTLRQHLELYDRKS